jgi:transposase-like protein
LEIVKLVVLAKNDCNCLYCSSTYSNVRLKKFSRSHNYTKKAECNIVEPGFSFNKCSYLYVS